MNFEPIKPILQYHFPKVHLALTKGTSWGVRTKYSHMKLHRIKWVTSIEPMSYSHHVSFFTKAGTGVRLVSQCALITRTCEDLLTATVLSK